MLHTISPNSPRTRLASSTSKDAIKNSLSNLRSTKFNTTTTAADSSSTVDENTTPMVRVRGVGAKRQLPMSKSSAAASSTKRRRRFSSKKSSPNPFAIGSITNDIHSMVRSSNTTPPSALDSEVAAAATVAVPATIHLAALSSFETTKSTTTAIATATATTPSGNKSVKKKKRHKKGKSTTKKKKRPSKISGFLSMNMLLKQVTKQNRTPPSTPADSAPFTASTAAAAATVVASDSTSTSIRTSDNTSISTTHTAVELTSTTPVAIKQHQKMEHSPAVASPLSHEQSVGKIQRRNSRRLSGTKGQTEKGEIARAMFLKKKNTAEKARLSKKMLTPEDKKRIRLAQKKKELMKSPSRLKIEKEHSIDSHIPSPTERRSSFGGILPSTAGTASTLSMSVEKKTSVLTSPLTSLDIPSTPLNLNSDDMNLGTPSSDISASDFNTNLDQLENNLEEDASSIILQRTYRGYIERKTWRHTLNLRTKAAISIATAWRTHVARQTLLKKEQEKRAHHAAMEELKRVEKEKTKKIVERREKKRRAALEKAQLVAASTKVASFFRRRLAQKAVMVMKVQQSSAIKVQAAYRASLARSQLSTLRSRRLRLRSCLATWKSRADQLNVVNTHAASIQARWRQYYQYGEYLAKRRSATIIQSVCRAMITRRQFPAMLRRWRVCVVNWSAMTVELVRRVKRRRSHDDKRALLAWRAAEVQHQNNAATTIQRLQRGRCGRIGYYAALEATRLAMEDERSAHTAAYLALAIERQRLASVVKRKQRGRGRVRFGTYTLSTNGHMSYSLHVELKTTTVTIYADQEEEQEEEQVCSGMMETRYSEIYTLDSQLRKEFSSVTLSTPLPSMPPKTWCKRTDVGFVQRRQRRLEEYLNILLQNEQIVKSWPMRSFFGRIR
jgi:hypothetical protein